MYGFFSKSSGIHCFIDIVEGDLIQWLGRFTATCATRYCNQSGILQLGQKPADDDRIRPDAACKKIAGNLVVFTKNIHGCEDVEGYREPA